MQWLNEHKHVYFFKRWSGVLRFSPSVRNWIKWLFYCKRFQTPGMDWSVWLPKVFSCACIILCYDKYITSCILSQLKMPDVTWRLIHFRAENKRQFQMPNYFLNTIFMFSHPKVFNLEAQREMGKKLREGIEIQPFVWIKKNYSTHHFTQNILDKPNILMWKSLQEHEKVLRWAFQDTERPCSSSST